MNSCSLSKACIGGHPLWHLLIMTIKIKTANTKNTSTQTCATELCKGSKGQQLVMHFITLQGTRSHFHIVNSMYTCTYAEVAQNAQNVEYY